MAGLVGELLRKLAVLIPDGAFLVDALSPGSILHVKCGFLQSDLPDNAQGMSLRGAVIMSV